MVDMLSYKMGFPNILKGDPLDSSRVLYAPPVDEFQVEKITIQASNQYMFSNGEFPGVCIVIQIFSISLPLLDHTSTAR